MRSSQSGACCENAHCENWSGEKRVVVVVECARLSVAAAVHSTSTLTYCSVVAVPHESVRGPSCIRMHAVADADVDNDGAMFLLCYARLLYTNSQIYMQAHQAHDINRLLRASCLHCCHSCWSVCWDSRLLVGVAKIIRYFRDMFCTDLLRVCVCVFSVVECEGSPHNSSTTRSHTHTVINENTKQHQHRSEFRSIWI